MIDREKLLDGLRCWAENSSENDCEHCHYGTQMGCRWGCEIVRMARDALTLLKAQEPKPPVIKENAYGWKFFYCPSCSREFYVYRRPERVNETIFCDKCGQAVKWE